MASPLFKFYVDGFLKQFNLEHLVKRNTDGDLLNIDNQIMWAKTRMSPDDVAAEMTSRLWVKAVAEDISELWVGSRMICRFDSVNGNLLFGLNDISTLPLEKGGTGYSAQGADPTAMLADLLFTHFGLRGGAFLAADNGPEELVKLDSSGKLPALDGSNLTGIANTPVGTVIAMAANYVPPGYLKCNGAAVSRTVYASLYSVMGTTWGAGDGSTTFTLPDLRGEFVRGWDDGRGIDAGRAFASFQVDMFKAHQHTYQVANSDGGSLHADAGAGNFIGNGNTSSVGGVETRPRNRALLFAIKY